MSINRNRSKFEKEVTNRNYTIKLKREIYNYCYICAKRNGCFYVDCSPVNIYSKGIHGNGKRIYAYKAREYKNWKYNRKTKWKI